MKRVPMIRLIKNVVRPYKFEMVIRFSQFRQFKDVCFGCGYRGSFNTYPVLSAELVESWNLDADYELFFNEREGKLCPNCGCSLRASSLAFGVSKGLCEIYGVTGHSLHTIVGKIRTSRRPAVAIAELNSAGSLHQFLTLLPNLIYTEYGSSNKAVRSEDIQNLTFSDSSLDMVITSEVLEHVPDLVSAFAEIHRVLVPNGVHVFTIPIHPDRNKSIRRATIEDGEIIHFHSPSYHGLPDTKSDDYLVFHEFGNDIYDFVSARGFLIEKITLPECSNPTVFCLFTTKI